MASRRKPSRNPTSAGGARARAPFPAALAAVLALVALAYWPSLETPYLFDDHGAIEENPYLEHSETWKWLTRVPENSTLIGRVALSWSFGLNALAFGHDPAAYHAGNLLIHLANVLLVALLARRGFAHSVLEEPLRSGASLAAALLWGVHPLGVNAVAYLIQRGESLSALWVLLTLYAWVRDQEPNAGRGWLALACGGPLLCAATKEQGWIAPFPPLLWAWVFLGRAPLAEIRRKPAFYAAGAASWLLLAALTRSSGRLAHVGAEPCIDAWSYFVSQPGVLTHYVRLFLVPIGQSFDYDWPVATLASAWPFLLLWAALFGAAAYAVWSRWAAGFPAAVLFVSLATSSSFLALPDLAFEHRFYLAGACLAALLVGSLARLLHRTPLALYAGTACAAVVLGALTWQRCTLFQDELAVWSEAIERDPTQRRALSNVGGILLARGQPEAALAYLHRVEEAGVPYRMQTRVHFQIGNALFDLGRFDAARFYYEKALETVSGDPGPIYRNLGHACLQQGDFAGARGSFEQSLATMDGLAVLHLDLAWACSQMGDAECMIRAYERGVALGGQPQPALRQLIEVFRPGQR